MLPKSRAARAHCRAVSGEIHSGFYNLRSALPMNVKARHPGYRLFAGAQPDVERVQEIWNDCLERYGGPFLFGASSMADAMYAPVCTLFQTYDVALDAACEAYCGAVLDWPLMVEWISAAEAEPEELGELEVEF